MSTRDIDKKLVRDGARNATNNNQDNNQASDRPRYSRANRNGTRHENDDAVRSLSERLNGIPERPSAPLPGYYPDFYDEPQLQRSQNQRGKLSIARPAPLHLSPGYNNLADLFKPIPATRQPATDFGKKDQAREQAAIYDEYFAANNDSSANYGNSAHQDDGENDPELKRAIEESIKLAKEAEAQQNKGKESGSAPKGDSNEGTSQQGAPAKETSQPGATVEKPKADSNSSSSGKPTPPDSKPKPPTPHSSADSKGKAEDAERAKEPKKEPAVKVDLSEFTVRAEKEEPWVTETTEQKRQTEALYQQSNKPKVVNPEIIRSPQEISKDHAAKQQQYNALCAQIMKLKEGLDDLRAVSRSMVVTVSEERQQKELAALKVELKQSQERLEKVKASMSFIPTRFQEAVDDVQKKIDKILSSKAQSKETLVAIQKQERLIMDLQFSSFALKGEMNMLQQEFEIAEAIEQEKIRQQMEEQRRQYLEKMRAQEEQRRKEQEKLRLEQEKDAAIQREIEMAKYRLRVQEEAEKTRATKEREKTSRQRAQDAIAQARVEAKERAEKAKLKAEQDQREKEKVQALQADAPKVDPTQAVNADPNLQTVNIHGQNVNLHLVDDDEEQKQLEEALRMSMEQPPKANEPAVAKPEPAPAQNPSDQPKVADKEAKVKQEEQSVLSEKDQLRIRVLEDKIKAINLLKKMSQMRRMEEVSNFEEVLRQEVRLKSQFRKIAEYSEIKTEREMEVIIEDRAKILFSDRFFDINCDEIEAHVELMNLKNEGPFRNDTQQKSADANENWKNLPYFFRYSENIKHFVLTVFYYSYSTKSGQKPQLRFHEVLFMPTILGFSSGGLDEHGNLDIDFEPLGTPEYHEIHRIISGEVRDEDITDRLKMSEEIARQNNKKGFEFLLHKPDVRFISVDTLAGNTCKTGKAMNKPRSLKEALAAMGISIPEQIRVAQQPQAVTLGVVNGANTGKATRGRGTGAVELEQYRPQPILPQPFSLFASPGPEAFSNLNYMWGRDLASRNTFNPYRAPELYGAPELNKEKDVGGNNPKKDLTSDGLLLWQAYGEAHGQGNVSTAGPSIDEVWAAAQRQGQVSIARQGQEQDWSKIDAPRMVRRQGPGQVQGQTQQSQAGNANGQSALGLGDRLPPAELPKRQS